MHSLAEQAILFLMPGGLYEREPHPRQRPDLLAQFFAETDPTKPGAKEAMRQAIFPLRDSLERRGARFIPSDEVLFARKLTQVGVEYMSQVNRDYDLQFNFFPGSKHFLEGQGFRKLRSDEQKVFRKHFMAALFGITLETLYDMVEDTPKEESRLSFDRKAWLNLYNMHFDSALGFGKATYEKNVPTGMFGKTNPQTHAEILSEEKTKRIREYVSQTGLHNIISYDMWGQLPYSVDGLFEVFYAMKTLLIGKDGISQEFDERAKLLLGQPTRQTQSVQKESSPVAWDATFWNKFFDSPLDPEK